MIVWAAELVVNTPLRAAAHNAGKACDLNCGPPSVTTSLLTALQQTASTLVNKGPSINKYVLVTANQPPEIGRPLSLQTVVAPVCLSLSGFTDATELEVRFRHAQHLSENVGVIWSLVVST